MRTCVGKHIKTRNTVSKTARQKTTVMAYGPNEDKMANKKDASWKELTEVVEDIKGRRIVLGGLGLWGLSPKADLLL